MARCAGWTPSTPLPKQMHARGYFYLELLARDIRYEAVVLADGYLDEMGYLEFSADDPDSMTINVALSR